MGMIIDNEEYLTFEDIKQLLGMNKTSLYALMKYGDFPKHKKLTARTIWKKSEVDNFIVAYTEKTKKTRIMD